MKKIDLTILRNYQELPKVSFRPIKVLEDKIFFAKYIKKNKYENYVEGIYLYDKENENIILLSSKEFSNYDMFVPSDYEDLLSLDGMNYIMFSTVLDNKYDETKSNIVIYAIDVYTNQQIEIFSIKYNPSEFFYSGFRILSDTYILIELENLYNEEVKEWDKLFILNIYTNEIVEIQDLMVKYTSGMLYIDNENKNVYVEEMYMQEEDEIAILTTDMYEIDTNIQESEVNPFKNSIKYDTVDDFLNTLNVDKLRLKMKTIDSINEEGILRVIGSTNEYIYYKKSKHQKELKESKEFLDRILLGKEEIFAIEKSTGLLQKITNLELGYVFSFDKDVYHKISDENTNIKIIDVSTGSIIYTYKKQNRAEEFSDFINARYLVVGVNPYMSSRKNMKVIDIQTGLLELDVKELIFVKDTFFYETM